jgi:hypothetical protein
MIRGFVEVREGVYERIDNIKRTPVAKKAGNKAKRKSPPPLSQSPLFHEPLSEVEGKEGDPSRLLVCIESVRSRLLDTDNLYGGAKFYCDFLRYCGAIPEDTEDEIELKVTQRKVRKGEEEKTIIEVWNRRG